MKKLLFILLMLSILSTSAPAEASIPKGTLGIDVSDVSEQDDLTAYAKKGAKYVIIRTSAYGHWLPNGQYGSDNASEQFQSAQKNNMFAMAYHRATFGDNASQAITEANFAVNYAKKYGIEPGGYLACDYEINAGKDKAKNTQAVLTFMDIVKKHGFQPLIYVGIDYARQAVDLNKVGAKYSNCVWLANYPKLGVVSTPNIEALHKLNVPHVMMYQFTDNWYGLNVDGNVLNLTLFPFHSYHAYATIPKEVPYYKTKTLSRVAGKITAHQTLYTKGYYFYNDIQYYTLYDRNNQWVGYVKAKDLKINTSTAGSHCSNPESYITVKNTNYKLLQELNTKTTKRTLVNNRESFYAKGHYHDYKTGYTYYSLYKMVNGKSVWQGYMNKDNLIFNHNDFGAFNRLNPQKTLTIKKSGYGIFKDKNFKNKVASTQDLINKQYTVTGYYDRIMGGGRYYSLYKNDTWIGYVKSTSGQLS